MLGFNTNASLSTYESSSLCLRFSNKLVQSTVSTTVVKHWSQFGGKTTLHVFQSFLLSILSFASTCENPHYCYSPTITIFEDCYFP